MIPFCSLTWYMFKCDEYKQHENKNKQEKRNTRPAATHTLTCTNFSQMLETFVIYEKDNKTLFALFYCKLVYKSK